MSETEIPMWADVRPEQWKDLRARGIMVNVNRDGQVVATRPPGQTPRIGIGRTPLLALAAAGVKL